MSSNEKVRVGISVGDLNGIGIEVILKTFKDSRMLDFCTPVIFASDAVLQYHKKQLKINLSFYKIKKGAPLKNGKINLIRVWNDFPKVEFGKETTTGGTYALKSLEAAVGALEKNEIDVLVTAPVNKHNIQSDRFKFPGHTDYLAQKFSGKSLMLMVAGGLRVGLLTDHLPVREAPGAITPSLIKEKTATIYDTLKKDFLIVKPKIAILGINPHTGDQGVIGSEDDEILRPVIKEIAASGMLVYGPYAADSFFASDTYKQFDAVLATYHDQGLIPFKTLAFGRGVNFTAGLSRIRTSPDHGTAFEIAGKGTAMHQSFEEAVFKAIEIFNNRKLYNRLQANAMQKA